MPREQQYAALRALYETAGGAHWQSVVDGNLVSGNAGWLSTVDPCSPTDPWQWVNCTEGSVVELLLSNSNLDGTIPSQLGLLTSLRRLNLSATNGRGRISGTLPSELGRLTALQQLHFYGNTISGSLPNLGMLSELKVFRGFGNYLQGIVPPWAFALPRLLDFTCGQQALSGTLPILGSTNLSRLDVSFSSLSGSIPAELFQKRSYGTVYLGATSFSGTLPTTLDGRLTDLSELYININSISGFIPTQLTALPSISKIALGADFLSGTLPPALGRLVDLNQLSITDTRLSGTVPSELGQLSRLDVLELQKHSLSGTLPLELGHVAAEKTCYLTALQCWSIGACGFNFRGNHFTCPLPDLSPNCGTGLVAYVSSSSQECKVAPSPPPSPAPAPPPPPPADDHYWRTMSVAIALPLVCAFLLAAVVYFRFLRRLRQDMHGQVLQEMELQHMEALLDVQQVASIRSILSSAAPSKRVKPSPNPFSPSPSLSLSPSPSCEAGSLPGSRLKRVVEKAIRHTSPPSLGKSGSVIMDGPRSIDLNSPHASGGTMGAVTVLDGRFLMDAKDLITGQPEHAARGLSHYMGVSDEELHEQLVYGTLTIRREIADYGTDEDKECLDYILHATAGSSDRVFPNGIRDRGRNGEVLADFVSHTYAQRSGLTEAHVLALRLYTSAAFKSINQPLRDRLAAATKIGRDQPRSRDQPAAVMINTASAQAPYPFPVTATLIAEGLKRLRTMGSQLDDAHTARTLWRGMRNVKPTEDFLSSGNPNPNSTP